MTGIFCGLRGRRRREQIRFTLEEKGYRKPKKKVKKIKKKKRR